MIWLLWNFAPGSQTPLQFYLQNTLHSNDAAFANWNALFAASFIPTFLLYGWLCQQVPAEAAALVGHGGRRSADGAAAVHALGRPARLSPPCRSA